MTDVEIIGYRRIQRRGFGVEQIAPPQIHAQRQSIDNGEWKWQPIPHPPAVDCPIDRRDNGFKKTGQHDSNLSRPISATEILRQSNCLSGMRRSRYVA